MYTPITKLLNVVKKTNGSRPGTERSVSHAVRGLNPELVSSADRCTGGSSIRIGTRWPKANPVSTTATTTVPPIPSMPTDRPLKTLVIMCASPVIVPTMPLARSRWASGISSVTVVDNAMLRSCPTTAPTRTRPANAQNHTPVQSATARVGTVRKTTAAPAKATRVTTVDTSIDVILRWASTNAPKNVPLRAPTSMEMPDISDAARIDLVSR
jgi:hypothetical protein